MRARRTYARRKSAARPLFDFVGAPQHAPTSPYSARHVRAPDVPVGRHGPARSTRSEHRSAPYKGNASGARPGSATCRMHARRCEALRPAHAPTRARTDAGRLNGRRGGRGAVVACRNPHGVQRPVHLLSCVLVCVQPLAGRSGLRRCGAGARARARSAPDDASAQAAAGQRAWALSAFSSALSILLSKQWAGRAIYMQMK